MEKLIQIHYINKKKIEASIIIITYIKIKISFHCKVIKARKILVQLKYEKTFNYKIDRIIEKYDN